MGGSMEERTKLLTRMVGKSIYIRRKSMGMSQEVLAEIIGIGQQSLSRMEQGKIAPKFERLQDFADALHCRVVDLFMPSEDAPDTCALMLTQLMTPLTSTQRAFIISQTKGLVRFVTTQSCNKG